MRPQNEFYIDQMLVLKETVMKITGKKFLECECESLSRPVHTV